MPNPTTTNGRATVRDVMDLQCRMFEEMKEIRQEISDLKARVYAQAAVVGFVVTLVVNVVILLIKKN